MAPDERERKALRQDEPDVEAHKKALKQDEPKLDAEDKKDDDTSDVEAHMHGSRGRHNL